jgi:hypothetical protein
MNRIELSEIFSLETRAGAEIRHHKTRLIPFMRVFSLRTPTGKAGLVWKKPSAMLVIYPDGQEQVLRVQDRTRQIVWSVILAGLCVSLVIHFRFGRKIQEMRQ